MEKFLPGPYETVTDYEGYLTGIGSKELKAVIFRPASVMAYYDRRKEYENTARLFARSKDMYDALKNVIYAMKEGGHINAETLEQIIHEVENGKWGK